MEINDIFRIIDEFDNSTFERCKQHLYRDIGFHIIPEQEVRRIDLKEKLATIFKQYPNIPRRNYEVSFIQFSEGVLSRHITVNEKNTRDCEYEAARKLLAKSLSEGGTSLSVFEDYFLIYLSECRDFTSIGDYEKKATIQDINYYLTEEDSETVEKIWHNVVKYDSTETKVNLLRKEKTATKTHEFKSNERLFMYILSVLFLFRVLQFEGEIK